MFLHLKRTIPSLKILVNYPRNKTRFYDFNVDILRKFVDIDNDMLLTDCNHTYDTVFVSSSLTHGGLSNSPPRSEIYLLYANMKIHSSVLSPKRIYISRRTWIHNNLSNIGTNYTTRRKMINEDLLVSRLAELGVCEIFTENLSMDNKLFLFRNAQLIIGSIGGGMSNLLFSPTTVHSLVIVTPFFLDINRRFRYSFEHTNVRYFNDVKIHKTANSTPLYCRCIIKRVGEMYDKIGEINDCVNDGIRERYLINISNNDVAGFNIDDIFIQEWFDITEFTLIDNGLNSPYEVDVDLLCNQVKDISNSL